VTLGNHDVESGHGSEQLSYLGLPPLPYVKRLLEVELLFLDVNQPDRRQRAGLDKQLGAPGPALRVVVFHQPAYSCGTVHGSTLAVIDRWVPILERHRVALVLNGHEHDYQRFISIAGVKVVLDPDTGVQDAIRHVFATFAGTGSAHAVVQEFYAADLLFPVRVRTGAHKGELAWMSLRHWRGATHPAQPRLRRRVRLRPASRTHRRQRKEDLRHPAREQWVALFPNAHPGYISWEQYETNQELLLSNPQSPRHQRAAGPARKAQRCCKAW
jgi:hypothetical protein